MTKGSASFSRRMLAWAIHLFTATGVIFGLLTVLEIERGSARRALWWLAAAVAVDAVDGTLARLVRVAEVLPRFDGVALDLIIDYFTCVIAPALFIYRFVELPQGLSLFCVISILVSAQFHYCNRDLHTTDHYFVGFPASWNIIAFYLYVLSAGAGINLAVIILFSLLTLTSLKCIHPFRVRELRRLTIMMTLSWGVIIGIVLYQLPERQGWLLWLSLLPLTYLSGLSLARTFRGFAGGRFDQK